MVGELGYRARFTTVGALERVLGRAPGAPDGPAHEAARAGAAA